MKTLHWDLLTNCRAKSNIKLARIIYTGANCSRTKGKVIVSETMQMVITDWLAVHTVLLQLTLQVT